MTDGVSNDPVIASTPAPISVEPRTAAPGEVAEISRQADEAKVPKAPEPAKTDPKGDEKAKPLSIRESLAKAREKLDAAPTTPAKPLSVAAPEPAKEAAKSAEPIAAKAAKAADAKGAEPVKEAAKDVPATTRGEDGKFVSSKPAVEAPTAAAKTADTVVVKEALPSHTAESPPSRLSAKAKEQWASLPEESRAEVTRMEKEFSAGFAKYKSAAERDGSIAEFHELAAKGGTTVKEALSKYVNMENQLRADPVKGLELIAKNAGLSLRDVAAKVLGQTPDQNASAADATIRDLTSRLERAEAAVGTIHQERQQAQTQTTHESVTKFAAMPEHSRFEELADDISFFLKSGRTKDLAEAYSMAERLNPAPATPQAEAAATPVAASSAAPARTTPTLVPAASSTDAGTRSIAGTPTAGSDPVRKQPSSSIKEAIRRAAAAAR